MPESAINRPAEMEPEDEQRSSHRAMRASFLRNVADQILRLAKSLVVLPLLPPQDLALFRFVSTLMAYLPLFHAGALPTMQFELPRHHARGDEISCTRLQAFAYLGTLVGSIGGFFFLAVSIWTSEIPWSPFWLIFSVCCMCYLPSNYVIASLQSRGEFIALVRIQLVNSVIIFVLALASTLWFGVHGLIFVTGIGGLTICLYGRNFFRLSILKQFDFSFVYRKLGTSLTFFLSSILTRTVRSSDIVVLGLLMGPQSVLLGLYGFGTLMASVVEAGITAISQVQGLTLLRNPDRNPNEITGLITQLTARDCFFCVFIASGVMIASTLGAYYVFPAYIPALLVVPSFMLACVTLRWRNYAAVFLNSRAQTKWINVGAAGGIIATLLHIWIVHKWFNDSLLGYSLCSAVAYTLDAGLVLTFLYVQLGQQRALLELVCRLFLAHLPAFCLMTPAFFGENNFWQLVLTGLLVPCFSALSFHWAFPGTLSELVKVFTRR